MTPVGHSLMGATLASLWLPFGLSKRWSVLGFSSFILLANLPDAPLPGWGHDFYHMSHSIFVNVAFIAALGAVASIWRLGRARLGGWRVLLGGATAWLSHLLLDTFYNHGRGLAMFWPLSEARLALPIPWFRTVNPLPPSVHYHLVRVGSVELLVYGAFLGLALAWRYRMQKARVAGR